ncbi:MAG: PAS domain S-box protein [Vicinamibacteria bacterium]
MIFTKHIIRRVSPSLARRRSLSRAKAILARRPRKRAGPRRSSRPPAGAAWRALAAVGSDAVLVVDAGDRIVDANRRAAEAFGAHEAELRGRMVGELLARDPEDAGKTWWSIVPTEPVRFQGRILRQRGEPRACEVTAQALPASQVMLVLGTSRDPETRLRDVSHHLSVAASKAPLIVWAVDAAMRFTTAQGSGLAALGIADGSQMLGRTAREVFPDLPEAIEYCERALTGESLHLRFLARGVTLENWYIPLRDAHGAVVGVQGVAVDVTERVRGEVESARILENLDEAQRVASIGSWEWDREAGEIRWSEELHRMLGVQRGADLVESFHARLHPDDRDQVLAMMRTVFDGAPAPLTLFRIVHPAHGVRWLEQRAAPRGRTPLVGTVQDVTAREVARLQLRRADERLREAQRVAQIGNWEWTPLVGIGYWSEELYRLLGIPPGAAPPSPATLLEAIQEADRPAFQRAIDEALAARPTSPVYGRVVRANGESRHVRFLAKLLSHGYEPDLLVGTLQDVTEWRRAEERMSVLSSALEQTADAAYVTDRDGTLLYVNEAFVTQSGYGREEALGRNIRLIKSGAHAAAFYEEFWRHILSGDVWRGTFVNRRKDASLYHQEMTVTPIRSEDGDVSHFVATGRDITERMGEEEAQARVREVVVRSAREWRATFDAVDSPILVLDAEARVRRPNRAARDLAGAPYSSLIGAPVQDLGTGALWRAMAQAAASVQGDGRAASLQVEDAASGRTWDVSASPLTEPGIDEGVVIVLGRDVSSVVGLQASLRRMETISAMGRLVAGVAHEVRNPLFAISATLDAFDAEGSANAGFLRYGDILRAEVRRLTDLMHDLLEYGRPTSPQLESCVLGPLVERACNGSAAIVRERQIVVAREVPADLPPVALDPGRFCQVLQNLVENAAQHSPAGATVWIRAKAVQGAARVEIQVADSGPGFDPEDLAHLFEPFYSRRRGGTGLGLSIVQRIVMEHGGEVQVSNQDGGGASVVVRLPALGHS